MGKKRRSKPNHAAAQVAVPQGTPAPTQDAAPEMRRHAPPRKKKKQQARAARKARAPSAVVHSPVEQAAEALAHTPLRPVSLPTAWTDHAASPEFAQRVFDLGAPADFGPASTLAGPLGTPAHFDLKSQVTGDLGAPAQFAEGPQLAGPLAGPALFEAPAPVVPTLPVVVARVVRQALPVPAARSPLWFPTLALLTASAAVAVYGIALRLLPKPVPVVVVEPAPVVPQPVYAALYRQPVFPDVVETFSPLPTWPHNAVIRGDRSSMKVALTFDVCSTTRFIGWDQRIMDILERYEVPATFFLGGRMVEQRPEIALLLAQNPMFDLQNHTFVHPHLPEITPARLVEELQRTDFAIFNAVGRRAFMFRPPFGEYSTDVVKTATRAGYLPVQFDVASGDPDPMFHWNKLLESVATQVGGGSIVVMHANGNGFHTAEALPLIIDVLRGRGLQLTTVGDVLATGTWVTDDGRKGPQRKKPAEKEKEKDTRKQKTARVAQGIITTSVAAPQVIP